MMKIYFTVFTREFLIFYFEGKMFRHSKEFKRCFLKKKAVIIVFNLVIELLKPFLNLNNLKMFFDFSRLNESSMFLN
jgi:hypothetical protein